MEKKTRNFSVFIPDSTGKAHEIRVLDFIENFLYIRPAPKQEKEVILGNEDDESSLILFKLNPQQMRFYLQIEDDWAHYRAIRYIVLKARQIGFSTLIAAIIFTLTIYSPYRESLVISDKDDHTKRIFEMYQRFYDHLPDEIRPTQAVGRKGNMLSTTNESTVSVETVSEDLARGSTLLAAHASEFAMWKKQKEAMASLNSAVHISPNTLLFIESTAQGMNFFRDLFVPAYAGTSKALKGWFEPWYRNDRYKSPYHGEELQRFGSYGDEVALIRDYGEGGLTNEGLMWRRAQIDAMGIDMFHQEYPTYPDEAFLTTGYSIFNAMKVQKRLEEVRRDVSYKTRGYFEYKEEHSPDDRRIRVTNIKFVEDPGGDVTIYEEPFPGYPYVLGGDPSSAHGLDYNSCQVIRHDGNCRKQVAKFRRQNMDPDMLGIYLYCLGTYYNNALIAVENNRGQATNKTLAKCGYSKIFVGQDTQGFEEDVLTKYGISTQGSNKEDMLNTLKARFREYPEEFVDENTLNEMLTYVVLDIGKTGRYIMGAIQGCHDDDVMALVMAHAAALTNQQTTSVNREAAKQAELPWQLRSDTPKASSPGRNIWKKSIIS